MFKPLLRRALGRFDVGLYRPSKLAAADRAYDPSVLPNVDQVIDVGVSHGTPDIWEAFPDATLLLVDPVKEEPSVATYLQGRPYTYVQAACGADFGEVVLHVDGDHYGRSSIFERTEYSRTGARTRQRTVPVVTIDSLVQKHLDPGARTGIKIDTEGYELEVLKGASETLRNVDWLICEVSVKERFVGSYRFEDLLDHVRSFGLRVTDVVEAPRNIHGEVEYVDLAFSRS